MCRKWAQQAPQPLPRPATIPACCFLKLQGRGLIQELLSRRWLYFTYTPATPRVALPSPLPFAGHGGAAGAVMWVSRAPCSAPASHCRALLPPRPAQFCSPEQEKRAARGSSSNVPCCKIYSSTSQNILRAQDQWDVTARPHHTVWCLWGVPCSFQPQVPPFIERLQVPGSVAPSPPVPVASRRISSLRPHTTSSSSARATRLMTRHREGTPARNQPQGAPAGAGAARGQR